MQGHAQPNSSLLIPLCTRPGVVMHRQVQGDFSDLPPKRTTSIGLFNSNPSPPWFSIMVLPPSTLRSPLSFAYITWQFITMQINTHTHTHSCTWPISSPYLIHQSANQGFVWHWIWISWQMGKWMKGVNSQEQGLVIGLLHLTQDPFGRNGWLAMRLGEIKHGH